jgi:DNA helicase-2/ATP-dependent DNA helicase PcrA
VLRQSGGVIGITPGFRIYGEEADREATLEEALQGSADELGGIRESDRRSLKLIDRMQQSLILPDTTAARGNTVSKDERISVIYRAYTASLSQHNALDYNSLILRTYELFSKYPKLAERQRRVYPHVCIDEFQDTNSSQYQLLRKLAPSPTSNLFAVADDDQVIYQWNGADYRRLDQFSRDYVPEALQLPLNYRCPAEVVDLSNRLISHNFGRFRFKSPTEAIRPPASEIAVRLLPPFEDFNEEAAGVANEIASNSSTGTVCVLARRAALLASVHAALSRVGVESLILKRKDEFESPALQWIHSCLRLGADRQDEGSLAALSGAFAALTGKVLEPADLAARAAANGKDLFSEWQEEARVFTLDSSFRPVLEAMGRLSSRLGAGEFIRLGKVWLTNLSGAAPSPSDEGDSKPADLSAEEWATWTSLYREISSSIGREPDLDTLLQELDMRSKEGTPNPEAVHLMTIHGAKGREYDHVYLIGLVEDELPSYHSRLRGADGPDMEEERRTCYVAITRTKVKLTLSFAREYSGRKRTPSRFISEMGLAASLGPGQLS